MQLMITGATGLTGEYLFSLLASASVTDAITCLTRPTSNLSALRELNLAIKYIEGDSSSFESWHSILASYTPETIIHIASIRHLSVLLPSLQQAQQTPRLIVVGTTGVYSQYNQYSSVYQTLEQRLATYEGSYCLLRPTMIYGSHRDKNLHKLIRFCHRYGFFPMFGTGECLLQPIHAEDLATALFAVWQDPAIQGTYDLSGGSVVSFKQLLKLVERLINKPIRVLQLPLNIGIWLASLSEALLQTRSPIRQEQILRLQEDKAYSHDRAAQDFNFYPRPLEVGLSQEVTLLKQQGML
ncbi:MAG: NAD-dependent epimerase/dehydratase family protein [Leptolyngbyaceae cyanobacterium]